MMRDRFNGERMIVIAMYMLVFYLCLPFSMTILNSVTIRLIALISICLFILGMMLMKKIKELLLLLLLFIFLLLYWQITWRPHLEAISYIYYYFLSLTFVFAGMILYYGKNENLLKHLFLFITIIYFITALTSIVGLNKYPLAARELARDSAYDTSLDFTIYKEIYRKMNIVSWSQVYGMLFAIPVSLIIWRKKRNPFYIILMALVFFMIVASQITFAVLLGITLAVLTLISRESNSKIILSIVALTVTGLIILINLEWTFNEVINLSEQAGLDFLATKLNDLKVLLIYNSAVGDASSRGGLYWISIQTFLDSPVFGLMASNNGASLEKIGFHSEMLDYIGTFGFVGLIIVIASFAGYFGFLKTIGRESRRTLSICFLGFILLGILNPVLNSPQIFIGAFLYPLLAMRYCGINVTQKHCKVILK